MGRLGYLCHVIEIMEQVEGVPGTFSMTFADFN
jgi:hypothetical protein